MILGVFKLSGQLMQTMSEIVNVRSYNDHSISESILNDMYNAFRMGPSSISTQASELLVVDDKNSRAKVIEATLDPYLTEDSYGAQTWLLHAPFMCIVLIEKRRAIARVGEKGIPIANQEANASIQNFRLLARSNGLSTACVREFDPKILKQNLDLPWYVNPIAILTAGYSDVELDTPPRLSIKDIVSREVWS